MQSLANPEIGGFFDIVRGGQGDGEGARRSSASCEQRFNAMWIVKWRLRCINSSVEQTFNLVFENTNPIIAPDGTFKDVPIGVDPTQWPLDVDVAKTVKAERRPTRSIRAARSRVYGDFCWSGDKTRAEAYFIPAGTNPIRTRTARTPRSPSRRCRRSWPRTCAARRRTRATRS